MRYEDLYEFLRKEKSSEGLQKLPQDFVKIFSEFIHEHKRNITKNGDFFSDDIVREKKQYENSMTMFKELILRRKKKLLNLVFIANETGVMKKDFDDMLSFEKELFEQILISVEQTDKLVSTLLLNGAVGLQETLILITEDVEQFVGMGGESLGPYKKGDSVRLDRRIADILVGGQKAISL
jgi:DNA replication initiation complex subunit (GINS family)